ncbi:MAG: glutathione transferase GstA [Deltaproteobacteria bacterium]|nr:glutathione transferase GstA [Deltaproteobacteria bacterium]
MELFFAPFACSLASHIAAREAGIELGLRQVSLSTKRTADGVDYLTIAPKGYVPALRLDDGTLLSENPVVLQYLADQRPEAGLLPAPGTRDRYAVLEWVGYISTEIHKGIFALIFNPASPEAAKQFARELAQKKLPLLAERLEGREFLATDRFTIADAYLIWALNLCAFAGISLDAWPALSTYLARMQARPSVRDALAYEQERFAA